MTAARVPFLPASLRRWVAGHRWCAASGLTVGLAMAVMGQKRLWYQESPWANAPSAQTLALFLGGLALFFVCALALGVPYWQRDDTLGVWADHGTAATGVRTFRRLTLFRLVGLLLALVLGIQAFHLNDQNTFTAFGSLCWIGALAVLVGAFWEWQSPPATWLRRPRLRFSLHGLGATWPFLALVVVTGLGAFFRFYRLSDVPSAMVSDHVEQVLDVKTVLDGHFSVYFPRLEGREGLLIYTAAGLAKFTPLHVDFLSLKFASVLPDILTIPATYLMARAALGNRWVGLAAAFFVAVSYWAIAESRFAMSYGFMTLAVAITLFFLFEALKHNNRNSFLLCGLALGLGMYAYRGFRLVPLAVALVVLAKLGADLISTRRFNWSLFGNALLSALVALIVFAPLGRYALDSPDDYWRRYGNVWAQGEQVAHPLSTLAGNLKHGLLMFNWVGDGNWWFNFPGRPAFDYVAGALLVAGLTLLVARWWRERESASLYVLFFLFVLLLPSILVLSYPEQNPSFPRMSGAIPLVAVLPAVGLYALGWALWRVLPGVAGVVGAVTAVAIVAGLVSAVSYDTYFNDYGDLYTSRVPNTSEIGDVISQFAREHGGLGNAYLISAPYWLDSKAVALEAGDLAWSDTNVLYAADQAASHVLKPGPLLYVMSIYDKESLSWLHAYYPRGKAREIVPPSGRRFMTFVTESPTAGGR
jgi:hypothetical protein